MMQGQHPMQKMMSDLAGNLKKARREQEHRLAVIDAIPANWQMAEVHYRAVKYGALNGNIRANCPCCNQRVESRPFSFCDGTTDPQMSSQVILFFSFVRTVIVYLVLHLLISDGYNLMTNIQGNACGGPGQLSCPKIFLTLLATANKHKHRNPLRTLDILNLILVVVSIIYFIIVRRFEYQRFNLIQNEVQTQDDYSVMVDGIPVLLYSQQTKQMDYISALTEYFSNVIRQWLRTAQANPDDPIYSSYLQMAQKYHHDPFNPPKIVCQVDLCWNMTEMNNLTRHKEELKDKVERNMGKGFLSMSHNQFDQVQASQRQGVGNLINVNFRESIDAIDEAYMDLTEKYDTDRSFDFCLSRFIGKAFVSFEYQQFAAVVLAKEQAEGLEFHGSPIKVQNASDPGDINWEDLHLSPEEKANRNKNTFWITGGSLVFAFVSVLLINYARNKWLMKMEEQGRSKASILINISTMIVVAIFVTLVNWLLTKFIWQLVSYEAHDSLTGQQRAYILKTLVAQFINTAISYVLVSFIMGKHIWDRSGIIIQVSVLFLFSTIIQLIANAIYLPSLKRLWVMSYYTYGQPVPKFQDRFNKQYALPEFHLSQRFVFYILQVYLVCFFSYLIPFGVPILLIAIIIHYYIDRINLFYRSSMTVHFNFTLLRNMYQLLQASILIFAIGNAIWSKYFHVNFWRKWNVIALAVALLFGLVIYLLRYRWELKVLCTTIDYEPVSYSDCERTGKFEHTYRSENPATALLFYQSKNFAYDQGYMAGQQGGIGGMGGGGMLNSQGMIGNVGQFGPPPGYGGYPNVNTSGLRQSPPGSYIQPSPPNGSYIQPMSGYA